MWVRRYGLILCMVGLGASCTTPQKTEPLGTPKNTRPSSSVPTLREDDPPKTQADQTDTEAGLTIEEAETSPQTPQNTTPSAQNPEEGTGTGGEYAWFQKTDFAFKNSQHVYTFHYKKNKQATADRGVNLGEWWPITAGLDLITRRSHPQVFSDLDQNGAPTYDDILTQFKGVALAPDGLTSGTSSIEIEGDSIIDGVRYPSSGTRYPLYGIIILNRNGIDIAFTHKLEILPQYANISGSDDDKMDAFFRDHEGKPDTTVFFLPVVKRYANEKKGSGNVHRALVRRQTPAGAQIGMLIFETPHSYDDTIKFVKALGRVDGRGNVLSETTHIYYTDGESKWGQAARRTSTQADPAERVAVKGTATYSALTNFLVIY